MSISKHIIVEFPAASGHGAAAAGDLVAAARDAAAAVGDGFGALLLPEVGHRKPGLDPTILAGALSGQTSARLIITADTFRHAPYNLARRVQSLNRITGGRVGVFLRSKGIDPVTAAARALASEAPDEAAAFREYLKVLARLWASFPEEALLGDREAGRLADPARIAPASFSGGTYSVAGALNVPLPLHQRAIVFAEAEEAGPDALVDGVFSSETGNPADWADAVPVFRTVTWLPDWVGELHHPAGVVVAGSSALAAQALLETAESTTTAGWLLRIPVTAGELPRHIEALRKALAVLEPAEPVNEPVEIHVSTGSTASGGGVRSWLAGLETPIEHHETKDLQAYAR